MLRNNDEENSIYNLVSRLYLGGILIITHRLPTKERKERDEKSDIPTSGNMLPSFCSGTDGGDEDLLQLSARQYGADY